MMIYLIEYDNLINFHSLLNEKDYSYNKLLLKSLILKEYDCLFSSFDEQHNINEVELFDDDLNNSEFIRMLSSGKFAIYDHILSYYNDEILFHKHLPLYLYNSDIKVVNKKPFFLIEYIRGV